MVFHKLISAVVVMDLCEWTFSKRDKPQLVFPRSPERSSQRPLQGNLVLLEVRGAKPKTGVAVVLIYFTSVSRESGDEDESGLEDLCFHLRSGTFEIGPLGENQELTTFMKRIQPPPV